MLKCRLSCTFTLLALSLLTCQGKVVFDTADEDIHALMSQKKATYVLRYTHEFEDTLFVPVGCVLRFNGGSLAGPIVFNETKLSGSIDLHGSTISGSISNDLFNASWLCHRDGVNDDAPLINQIINVCHNVFFPKGVYYLVSKYLPSDMTDENYIKAIHSHIGINKNGVSLRGEDGTIFLTDKPLGVITIYSKPYDIEGNVKDIKIESITFKVNNNGVDFHEPIYVIEAIGINGFLINNCFFDDFWGDAICLSHYGDNAKTGERTRNQNVNILNNTIIGGSHHNNRNGISVINGKNVIIMNNVIKNTSRKDMPGGIDVEPNNSAYTMEDIRIEKNTIEGVKGNMGAISIVLPHDDAPAHGIYIVNNTIRNCSWGISVRVATQNTSSDFVIAKNYIADDTSPYNFGGKGSSKDWVIRDNYFGKPRTQAIPGNIKVENLVIKNNKKKD